ncbi:hypothetical protein D9M68_909850 [compost metagenome]
MQVAGFEYAQRCRAGAFDPPGELFLGEETVEQHHVRLQLGNEGIEALAVQRDCHFRYAKGAEVCPVLRQRRGAGEGDLPGLGSEQFEQLDNAAARGRGAWLGPDVTDNQDFLHERFHWHVGDGRRL